MALIFCRTRPNENSKTCGIGAWAVALHVFLNR